MSKLVAVLSLSLSLALSLSLLAPGRAHADDAAAKRAAAQKAIDDAKVKSCEVIKSTIAKSKACTAQAAEAASITCTPQVFTQVNALNTACMEAIKASAKATAATSTAASTKPATADKPAKTVACKATDDKGAALASATGASLTDCRKQLKTALTTAVCTGGVKNLKYLFVKDGGKPAKSFLFCPKPPATK